MIDKRVPHIGSYIITHEEIYEFKYGVLNNMRDYLFFDDADEMAQKMEELLSQREKVI